MTLRELFPVSSKVANKFFDLPIQVRSRIGKIMCDDYARFRVAAPSEGLAKRRVTLPHIQTVEFDEALSRLGIGKFNYAFVVLGGIIITVASFETIGMSFVFPIAQCEFDFTTQQKGVLSGISSMGIILGSYLWGFCSDLKGRKKVIVPTLFLTFASSAFSSLAPNYVLLLLFRFLSGFFVSGSSATIYAYLSEFHSSTNRSKILLAASFVYGFACNYLAILGYFLLNEDFSFFIPFLNIEYNSWRTYLLACGVPSLLCAIGLLFLPESPKFLYSQGNEEEALKVLYKVYLINNPGDVRGYRVKKLIEDQEFLDKPSTVSDNSTPSALTMLWMQTKSLFLGEHFQKTTLICVVQFLLYGSCHGLYMFFPEIVDKIETFSKDFPGQNCTICEIIASGEKEEEDPICNDKIEAGAFGYSLVLESLYMVGFLIITFLVNRITKLSILLFILFGCGACGISTLFTTTPLLSIFLYVGFMLTFLGVNIVCAATCSLYPTKLRGIAMNVSMMFGRIGSTVSTFVVGRTLDDYCQSTFLVSASLMILCGVLCIFIPKIRQVDGRR